ncbi:MAG: phage tail protein [Shewanella sp.]
MAAKYFAILTNLGAAKLANATALGTQLEITHMAVGDGGGGLPIPNPAQTALIGERRLAAINLLTIDPLNNSQIIAEQVIPEDVGGWWIREVGLFDKDGTLVAIANCPETYKPQLQEGSGRTQTIRVILIVSSTQSVSLKIDPSVVLATRKYVDDNVIEVTAYVDTLLNRHLSAKNPHSQYAPMDSPVLIGKPTAPTPLQVANDQSIATAAFVKQAIANLVGASPEALDTLNELAAALGDDPNFATTVTEALADKLAKSANGADILDKDLFLHNLNIGSAAKCSVGSGDGQIPDMSFFSSTDSVQFLPSGWIIQVITVPSIPAFGGVTLKYPTPFPKKLIGAVGTGGATSPNVPSFNTQSIDRFSIKVWNQSTSMATQIGSLIVIGV